MWEPIITENLIPINRSQYSHNTIATFLGIIIVLSPHRGYIKTNVFDNTLDTN